jgi:Zn-dependent protease with chaperone function
MATLTKNQLPLSDWITIIFFILLCPLLGLTILVFLAVALNDNILFLVILNIGMAIILFISFLFYRISFKKLENYAKKVDYYHLTPSILDLIIHLIKQVYYVLIIGFLFSLILEFVFPTENLEIPRLLVTSLVLSIGIASFHLGFQMRAKQELVKTAQEPVDTAIIEKINQEEAESQKIMRFQFAEIQIASLFLSAGVTSFGLNKYICLISRYFNWKLTDDELLAVLFHEVGHVKNNHILKMYLLLGIEAFLRALRFFVVLIGLFFFLHTELIQTFSPLIISYLILLLLVFFASALLTFTMKYRVYLAEIWADEYSAEKIGAENLAIILRKLPSMIPSPLGYDQSSFLGFRVNLLRSLND